MMKFLFAFFVLLPLCKTMHIGMNLSKEIRSTLEELQANKVTTTSKDVDVPSREMQNHALSCEGVFIKELYQLLGKVTVPSSLTESFETFRETLKNFTIPGENGQQKNVHPCRMSKSSMPFKQYINFLMKLNSMRKIPSTTSN